MPAVGSGSDASLLGRVVEIGERLERQGVWLSYSTNHAAPGCCQSEVEYYEDLKQRPGGLFPDLGKVRAAAEIVNLYTSKRAGYRCSGRMLIRMLQSSAEAIIPHPLPVYGEFLMAFLLLGFKIQWDDDDDDDDEDEDDDDARSDTDRSHQQRQMREDPIVLNCKLLHNPWNSDDEARRPPPRQNRRRRRRRNRRRRRQKHSLTTISGGGSGTTTTTIIAAIINTSDNQVQSKVRF